MSVKSLDDFKTTKKSKKIVEDLTQVVHIMNLTLQGLSYYSKYIPVMESISVLQTSKTLLEIHLNKHKKAIEVKDG
jgi:heme-binding NEAT domain protein